MRNSFRVFLRLSLVLFCISFHSLPSVCGNDNVLISDFKLPDRDYAPMTWWHWINGHMTKEGIRKDLQAMHKAGIRGVQVFNTHMYLAPGPIEFASDEWYDMAGYAISLCDSLGMKFCITSGAGWSGSGGPWITKEQAMKKITMSETFVTGGKVGTRLALPVIKDGYYREIAVQAVPAKYRKGQIPDLNEKTFCKYKASLDYGFAKDCEAIGHDEIIELTEYADSTGWLECELPEGEWCILRFGYTLTGSKAHPAAWGGEGYEVNKLDSADVAVQYDNFLKVLFDRNKKYLGNTFEGVLFDSYEAGFQNWTKDLPREFRLKYGYDLLDYMPVFTGRVVGSIQMTEQVLYDFRSLLDYMISEFYYGTMQKRINALGMVTYAEAQGGPVPSQALNFVDIPMNEFWNPDTSPRAKSIRLTSSQADLRGKGIVAAEAFTSKPEDGKWQNYPGKLKKPGDLAYVCGINRFCFHTYAHQPVDYAPGFALGRYGTIFSRLSTWWDYASGWVTYLSRCQYLLQQGVKVADITFLFHNDIRYTYESRLTKIPEGYDYRVAYPEDLAGAEVRNGKIVFSNGAESSILFVIPNAGMDMATLEKLAWLTEQGAVICGEPPVAQSSMSESFEYPADAFGKIVERLWGSRKGKYVHKVGNGLVLSGYSYPDAISYIGIDKDAYFGEDSEGIHYLHKKIGDTDMYFVSNQNGSHMSVDGKFRTRKKYCSLWNPVTGEVYNVRAGLSGQFSKVKLDLASFESVFVIFTDYPMTDKCDEKIRLASEFTIKAPWKLEFEDVRQVKEPVEFDVLIPLNENRSPEIKYYSGTTIYNNSFEINENPNGKKVNVLFDEIYDIAEVFINGSSAGILWTRPYALDITRFIRKGNNEITVKVANTWINRIVGDEQLEPDMKYEMDGGKFTSGRLAAFPEWLYSGMPSDRERMTFYTWKHYDKNSPLVPSGLCGEVKIKCYR